MEDSRRPTILAEASLRRRLFSALALHLPVDGPCLRPVLDEVKGRRDVDWWSSVELEGGVLADLELKAKRKTMLAQLLSRRAEEVGAEVGNWEGAVLLYGEKGYPEGLKELDHPPAALHIKGRIDALEAPGLAVVGSRKIGVAAARAARRLVEPFVARGGVVISGGALGADALAHRCAIDGGGRTVAILPSGLRQLSPKRNSRLFTAIAKERGALLTEYPPGKGVRKFHFHRRNRLIAAMSRGILVLRAAHRSGTMLTVRAARELNRPLAAMPGAPDEPLAAGCHDIIQKGGRLIARGEDLLQWWADIAPESMSHKEDLAADRQGDAPVLPDCEVLQAAVELVGDDGAFSVEALSRVTGKSAGELQTLLLRHELSGAIEAVAGAQRYRLR